MPSDEDLASKVVAPEKSPEVSTEELKKEPK